MLHRGKEKSKSDFIDKMATMIADEFIEEFHLDDDDHLARDWLKDRIKTFGSIAALPVKTKIIDGDRF
ncbi:MAG: hypothetical protein DSY80_06335 [Desulfocapsa sp.]|nr:MAG: hypothetical protein DSY80_06335 [Desulfocapsa sp.]